MGEAQALTAESEDQILKEAETLATQGQWRKAALLLGNGASGLALSARAQGAEAFYYSRAGDHEKAIALFQELCQSQPAEAKWRYYLGFQFQQTEQWDHAIATLEQALRLAPKWLKVHLALGQAYEQAGQLENALSMYRQGRELYKGLPADARLRSVAIFAKLCRRAADLLLARVPQHSEGTGEALECLCESAEAEPHDTNSWYRLGSHLVSLGRLDEALVYLHKAEALGPRKEYVSHKLAQVSLKQGNVDEALRIYEKIPLHRQVPYILRGIAQCYLAKGQPLEAAKKLNQAIRKEPEKFYHYWDFALALIELNARDQAIEALEKANQLFEKEHGKSYKRAMAKIEEILSTLPAGEPISFDNTATPVSTIGFGSVTKYDQSRGFGFIKDRSDGAKVFFHISRVKERTPPEVGSHVKFVRELGEKGLQAARVWIL